MANPYFVQPGTNSGMPPNTPFIPNNPVQYQTPSSNSAPMHPSTQPPNHPQVFNPHQNNAPVYQPQQTTDQQFSQPHRATGYQPNNGAQSTESFDTSAEELLSASAPFLKLGFASAKSAYGTGKQIVDSRVIPFFFLLPRLVNLSILKTSSFIFN